MKKNLSMMGGKQRGGYNNEKEKGGKISVSAGFCKEDERENSVLIPAHICFFLSSFGIFPGPIITRLRQQITRFHRMFSFEMNPLQDRDVFHLFPRLKRQEIKFLCLY
ncbi:hypothetical protein CEXT_328211 [Caerostris extrusa]|uniref:Uncharacterized protein n=1 Tax=Caerostris extrusa TaxID=172846 RepID=A0AAV4TN33_CAEEX|nr:hypothetical protein CEXT_328211 [Caerostris extrusa]